MRTHKRLIDILEPGFGEDLTQLSDIAAALHEGHHDLVDAAGPGQGQIVPVRPW